MRHFGVLSGSVQFVLPLPPLPQPVTAPDVAHVQRLQPVWNSSQLSGQRAAAVLDVVAVSAVVGTAFVLARGIVVATTLAAVVAIVPVVTTVPVATGFVGVLAVLGAVLAAVAASVAAVTDVVVAAPAVLLFRSRRAVVVAFAVAMPTGVDFTPAVVAAAVAAASVAAVGAMVVAFVVGVSPAVSPAVWTKVLFVSAVDAGCGVESVVALAVVVAVLTVGDVGVASVAVVVAAGVTMVAVDKASASLSKLANLRWGLVFASRLEGSARVLTEDNRHSVLSARNDRARHASLAEHLSLQAPSDSALVCLPTRLPV